MARFAICFGLALSVLPSLDSALGPSQAAAQGGAPNAQAATSSTASADWLTWGGGNEKYSWARAERTLSPNNVSNLQLKWMAQLDNPAGELELTTITAPLVATNVATRLGPKTLIFVVGSKDHIYALDSENGSIVWQKNIPRTVTTELTPTWLCPLSQNATPVIDKDAGLIYVLTSEGKLTALSITDGSERMAPTDFVRPFSRSWSLTLLDGVIYTSLGRGCGGAAAEMAAMDVRDRAHPVVRFNTSTARPAGAWGRAGPVVGPRGLHFMTATGAYNPDNNQWGDSFMLFERRTMKLLDWYSPENRAFISQKDFGGSASPMVFPFRNWSLVVGTNKGGFVWMLDENNLGGANHETPLYVSPRWGNEEELLYGRGVWGAMATWLDPAGERWLYLPMWGPPSLPFASYQYVHGQQESGSIMAFKLTVENDKPAMTPVWISSSMAVPEPPVIANGVVFSLASGENTRQRFYGSQPADRFNMVTNASLHAFDAMTGRELYDSGSIIKDWSHFGGLAVVNGRVYFATHGNRVYSFGLP